MNDAVQYREVEGAAAVVALSRELQKLLDMFGCFIGSKFETERTKIGGDDCFQSRRVLCPTCRQGEKRKNDTHRLIMADYKDNFTWLVCRPILPRV